MLTDTENDIEQQRAWLAACETRRDFEHFMRAKHLTDARLVGIHRDHVWKYGRFHDLHVFEQTRAEWEATRRMFVLETTLGAFPS